MERWIPASLNLPATNRKIWLLAAIGNVNKTMSRKRMYRARLFRPEISITLPAR